MKLCVYIYFLFVTMPYSIVNLCAFDKRSIKSVLTYLLTSRKMQKCRLKQFSTVCVSCQLFSWQTYGDFQKKIVSNHMYPENHEGTYK